MNLDLGRKTVVVTGGGRGIGKAICQAFAREGANVVVADINLDGAVAVAKAVESMKTEAIPVKADCSRLAEVEALMEAAFNRFKQIDILINNAGISPKKDGGPIITWEIKPEEWDMVMDVNLKGTLFCSQLAIEYMLPKGKGTIVNVSSIAGKAAYQDFPTGAHYNASKAAIISLTQRLAREAGPYGIRVNAVAPGRIETALAEITSSEMNQIMLERTPMRRFGRPEEVADLILFLSSEVSGFITGETVSINGGMFMD